MYYLSYVNLFFFFLYIIEMKFKRLSMRKDIPQFFFSELYHKL